MKKIIIAGMLALCFAVKVQGGTAIDSVGVEKINGQSFIIHQVEERETLFGISRRYKTPVNEIIQSNEELRQGLKIGQRIKIPFIEKSAIPAGAKLHHVAPGETLFSISQVYKVAVSDLMSWNQLQGNDLSVGQSLIIKGVATPQPETPAEVPQIAEAKKEEKAPEKKPKANEAKKPVEQKPSPASSTVLTAGGWLTHQVEQGQTLFSIAKQYDAKVEDLINWNGLTSNNLALGQQLKVGRDKANTVPTVVSPTSSTRPVERPVSAAEPNSGPAASPTSSSTAYKNIKEVGQAEVIEGTGNHKKYLVLHRTAPVGTIMRIRNEENDITVFARVVGVLPDTGDNNRLLIKVSKAAYDQLRAVNSRFPVEVSY